MRKIIKEESEYQKFFKRELEKRGEDIEDMSDSEKKEFFNKIDRQWKAKDEAVRKKGSKKSGRSVAIIQKEYAKVISDMQDNLAKYKGAKNDSEKKPYVEVLKGLTAKKKKLQAELDSAVKGLYRGAELQIDEATKTMKSKIRQIVREELMRYKIMGKSVNEANIGDKMKHKYIDGLYIELLDTTNKGWKVKQTGDGTSKGKNKTKIAYYNSIDITGGDKALFVKESINGGIRNLRKNFIG